MSARAPAVAGLFYPAEAPLLLAQLDALLAPGGQCDGPAPKALIVPHAGYRYSGPTAASAYCRLRGTGDRVRRVVLLGPAHRVYLEAMALPRVDQFDTPLGAVPIDREARRAAALLPGVCLDDQAHAREHSIEVQLPFLQTLFPKGFDLLPVLGGNCPPAQVAALLNTVCAAPGTLVVISTDLSHFHSYAQAQQLDRNTCERILARAGDFRGEEACGAHPLNGLMHCRLAAQLDIELLDYCNSGDRGGDRERVVGYGAFALH